MRQQSTYAKLRARSSADASIPSTRSPSTSSRARSPALSARPALLQLDRADALVPMAVPGVADAGSIVDAGTHACVLRDDATVTCWGVAYDGQTGDGRVLRSSVPLAVVFPAN